MFLSRGRPFLRKLILGKGDPKELSSALVGNSVLLAQPDTGEVQKMIPPAPENMSDALSVIFTTNRSDVKRARPLLISRSLYLECAHLRRRICYAYADVCVGDATHLPENGVPDQIVEEAIHLPEAKYFEPTFDSVAKVGDPCAKFSEEKINAETEDDDKETNTGEQPNPQVDEGHVPDDSHSGENIDDETILGMDEAHKDDPMGQFLLLQKRLELVKKEGEHVLRTQRKLKAFPASGDGAAVGLQAGLEQCKQHFVDLKDVCSKIKPEQLAARDPDNHKDNYRHKLDAAMDIWITMQQSGDQTTIAPASASHVHVQGGSAGSSSDPCPPAANEALGSVQQVPQGQDQQTGLNMKAGAPLNMFDPFSWVYSFVEFFYGDCLPADPRRQVKLSFEQVFRCLTLREELQYSLATDEEQYQAGPMSRWDTPLFSLVFGSTLRSLQLLQSSKLTFYRGNNAESFSADLKAIAEATPEDFERSLAFETHGGAKSLLEVFVAPETKKRNPKLHIALKHLFMQTAVVPLTEGNKIKMRHMSFASSLYFGALKLFMTTNFADTYSPLVLKLYGAGDERYIGEIKIDLFEDAPNMPTLKRMHEIVAAHPSIQARLFLLMEQLTITELLCARSAFIGDTILESQDKSFDFHDREDEYASDGSPGLANFLACLIEPLETQGRGFTHGHKQVMGVPQTRIAAVEEMFQSTDEELQKTLARIREVVLQAVSTIQYDSAELAAKQLGVEVRPAPFTHKQQLQTRFDGGLEMDGVTYRPNLDVTPEEPKGHVVRERALAEVEQRSQKDSYKQVPLTGCHQAMLPGYRSNAAFGRMESFELDETGLCQATKLAHVWQNPKLTAYDAMWDSGADGEIVGVLDSSLQLASKEALEQDADAWAVCYARHVRAQTSQNNIHGCQKTCTKYFDDKKSKQTQANKPQASVCRFYFFMILVFDVFDNVRSTTKTILRRGKKLISNAFIASTNERNEYGRGVVERPHPFVSSTSDLLQASLQCNSDLQFMDRAVPPTEGGPRVPDDDTGSEGRSNVLYGVRSLSLLKTSCLRAYKIGMRAACICDFYMTKYHAKAQQVLSSALPAIVAGLRRCEAEENEMPEGSLTFRDKAMKRLRRMTFAANKSHWFSAAELSIYVLTGGHCIMTHKDLPLFTSRIHYMCQECKRFKNNEDVLTISEGAAQSAQRQMVDAIVVVAADAATGAEDTNGGCLDDVVQDRAPASELHVFKSNTSIIDDWLHRGPTLIDYTLDQYCIDIERIKVGFESAMDCQSIIVPFEEHYAMSKQYAQKKRVRKVLPRIVGPQCASVNDNDGENHALYMHLLFTPVRCMGRDHCADCRNFAGMLFPAASGKYTFEMAWKARRA